MMEGELFAAPRLVRDYYAQDGWQPLPCVSLEGASVLVKQAPLLAAEINLQALNKSSASAPIDGQAGVYETDFCGKHGNIKVAAVGSP